MPKPGTKKCLCCQHFFKPTAQSKGRQNYCSHPQCKKASKKASQEKWLAKPENRDYFKSTTHVQQVQQCQKDSPDYSKGYTRSDPKPTQHNQTSLQDSLMAQLTDKKEKNNDLTQDTLQETLISQVLVLMEVMTHLDTNALQALQEMIDFIRQKEDNFSNTFLTKFRQFIGNAYEHIEFTQSQQMPGNSASI